MTIEGAHVRGTFVIELEGDRDSHPERNRRAKKKTTSHSCLQELYYLAFNSDWFKILPGSPTVREDTLMYIHGECKRVRFGKSHMLE